MGIEGPARSVPERSLTFPYGKPSVIEVNWVTRYLLRCGRCHCRRFICFSVVIGAGLRPGECRAIDLPSKRSSPITNSSASAGRLVRSARRRTAKASLQSSLSNALRSGIPINYRNRPRFMEILDLLEARPILQKPGARK